MAGRGEFDEAIEQYGKVLKINPGDAKAHYNLANALAGRGRFEEAIVHYRKALEITPDHAIAHYRLALALAGRGEVEDAIVHYRQALALATARNNRALADAIRAQIRHCQSLAPAGKAPSAPAEFIFIPKPTGHRPLPSPRQPGSIEAVLYHARVADATFW